MQEEDEGFPAWDLGAAIEALYADRFSQNGSSSDAASQSENSTSATSIVVPDRGQDCDSGQSEAIREVSTLGDFGILWDFLNPELHSLNKPENSAALEANPHILDLDDTLFDAGQVDNSQDVSAAAARATPSPVDAGIPNDTMRKKKKAHEEAGVTKREAVAKRGGSQNDATLGQASPPNKITGDENRRRKIMIEFSDPPLAVVSTPKKISKPPPHLLPSSIPSKSVTPKKPSSITIQPVDLSLSTAKKTAIMHLLEQRFPGLTWLPASSATAQNSLAQSQGIHVFVDISNVGVLVLMMTPYHLLIHRWQILIGFHDTLKIRWGFAKSRRDLTRGHRLPRQTLSFHNLSLVLERGRPVAKKLLAGSDTLECIHEAQDLGYTAHILARVEKPEVDRLAPAFTDSDSARRASHKVKKGEQAVDEILQLHMQNSILDNDSPSTIVLASGDAAQGQFSDGFLRVVERGLSKGWNVEIIAWSANISYAYRSTAWLSHWGSAVRVIELDDFAELMHIEKGS